MPWNFTVLLRRLGKVWEQTGKSDAMMESYSECRGSLLISSKADRIITDRNIEYIGGRNF
jgi:hypothetical protein